MNPAPIGILDSGVGGLTVFRQIRLQLPHESIHYIADTANVPYGDKPLSIVRDLALTLSGHLIQSGSKIVVMASGTSTVAGLTAAQKQFPDTPIFGVIDAGSRAAIEAGLGPIGVLATNATAHSRAFTHAIHQLAPGREVIEQGCPKFVPLVESGKANTDEAFDAACEYLAPLLDGGVEAVILGCTHFPFLVPALQKASNQYAAFRTSNIIFVDPAEEVVREIKLFLTRKYIHRTLDAGTPQMHFEATGDPEDFRFHASNLLGTTIPPVDSYEF